MVWDEKYDLGHRNFFFWGRKCGRGIKPEQGSSWGYVCGFLNEKFLSSVKKSSGGGKDAAAMTRQTVKPPTPSNTNGS